jgi:S1-C subfamily serine protease
MKLVGYVEVPDVMMGVIFKQGTNTVSELPQGSPASEAGIEIGDRILSVDGKPVHTLRDSLLALADKEAGDVARVEVDRGKRILHLSIRLRSPSD